MKSGLSATDSSGIQHLASKATAPLGGGSFLVNRALKTVAWLLFWAAFLALIWLGNVNNEGPPVP